ncbi:MAG: hypothetical protein RL358_60 [Pseudomonadota bacterium]|jgi:diguanylate cyclase (GGDEF)-like protein
MALFNEARFTQLKVSGKLPSPKGVALQLIGLAQQENASHPEIVRLISTDPALSVRVIKAANVLLGSTSRPVTGINDAVTVLGLRALRQLVLGIVLILDHRHGPCKSFDYGHFWVHSLLTGIIARHLAACTCAVAAEDIFMVGLLSKIGRLGLASVYPDEFSAMLAQHTSQPELKQLQVAQFGFTECELSAAILSDMNFPQVFQTLVRDYIQPEHSEVLEGSREWQLVYLLHIAALIAELCLAAPAQRAVLLQQVIMQGARIALESSALLSLCEAAMRDWSDWADLLGMPPRNMPDFAELFQQHDEAVDLPSLHTFHAPQAAHDFVLRVLVVDDDRGFLALLRNLLESQGYCVFTAPNGVAAMAQIELHHPQLIITDWRMPLMDGLSLCRTLRDSAEYCDIYLIVMTTQEDPEKLIEAFEAGADDYLVKPLVPKIFFARLRSGLRVVKLQAELASEHQQLLMLSTELASANKDLHKLALTDVLTGLSNRRAAMECLAKHWAGAERSNRALSCMMVDIDHFKSINDQFGHPIGDVTLQGVAAALLQSARAQDLVCRVGGEEFLVICPDTSSEAAYLCAERLRQNVMSLVIPNEHAAIQVTVSIGVASKATSISSVEALLGRADQHLYAAKQAGRNCTVATHEELTTLIKK